jgi:hypothetical protein
LAIRYRTPLDLKMSRFKEELANCRPRTCDFSTKEVFHPKPEEDFKPKKSRQFIDWAIQPVFLLCQSAIQW